MARLVPARPLNDTPAEESAVLALERGLDDAWVVIQRRSVGGALLAVHPERGACLVAVAAGPQAWDPDAETYGGVDPRELARAAGGALSDLWPFPLRAVAFLPDTATPISRDPAVVLADAGGLAAAVLSCMPGDGPGDPAVEALLQSVSPGAAPYVRNTVTAAQTAWRAAVVRSSLPASRLPDRADAAAAIGPSAMPPMPETPREPDIKEDDPLIGLVRTLVLSVAEGREIFIQGMKSSAEESAAPDFGLPALLVCAGEDWTPVVISGQGKGGFLIHLRSDKDSLLGFRVTKVEPSSLFLFGVALASKLRKCIRRAEDGSEEVVLDPLVEQFARFLSTNGINLDDIEDLGTRVLMKKISV